MKPLTLGQARELADLCGPVDIYLKGHDCSHLDELVALGLAEHHVLEKYERWRPTEAGQRAWRIHRIWMASSG